MTAWIADFLSPSNFVQPIFSCPPVGVPTNYSRLCDPALDAAASRAVAARGVEANARWSRLDRRIMRAAPLVPLDVPRSLVLVSRRVGDVQQHLQLGPLLDQIWVR